jgi:hypothetical protein
MRTRLFARGSPGGNRVAHRKRRPSWSVWSLIFERGDDAFAKVFLAHSLADVQDSPEDELAWDLRALR